MINLVCIVGNKRSGSTQLMHLLNLHPNIFISNESDIIWILYRFHQNLDITPYRWDTPVGMNATMEKFGHLLSKDKTPYENFVTLQTEIMEKGLLKVKPMHKEKLLFIGDQKPFQQIDPEILPFIKTHFPNAQFLHLIRHPFPVVLSSQVFYGGVLWKGMSADEILARWTMHEQWVEQAKTNANIPILDVKYEDIVTDTRAAMIKMFDFIGVPYDDAVLEAARRSTRDEVKLHPRLHCPPETLEIMEKYGYKPRNFWLEQKWWVNLANLPQKVRKKLKRLRSKYLGSGK